MLTDPGVGTTLLCPYCATSVVIPSELIAARNAAQSSANASADEPAGDSFWQVGEKVLAYFDTDGYWYAAEIVQATGSDFRIRFLIDGEEDNVDETSLSELLVEADDVVESFYKQEELYYSAIVKQVKGDRVEVEYEDGEREWTDIAHLRYSDDWEEGDRVFVYWESDEYYYPATITEIDGEDITVRCDDGDTATVTSDELEMLILEIDDEVESKWSKDKKFYTAYVKDMDGERVQVEYEDGIVEWTTVSNLRVSLTDEE
jgi:hypothetical protein